MDKKYITFYKKFILQTKTLNDGRVEKNGALKGEYYGRFSSNGFCFRNGRGCSISPTRKTYKDSETKGNSRRGLHRRVMHQTNLINHRRIKTSLDFDAL